MTGAPPLVARNARIAVICSLILWALTACVGDEDDAGSTDQLCTSLCHQDIACYDRDISHSQCVNDCLRDWAYFDDTEAPSCFHREFDAAMCESELSCSDLANSAAHCGAEYDSADDACD